jgi:hypothetical protein
VRLTASTIACGTAVFLAAAGAGCQQILDIPSDPMVVATGPWRCLGQAPASATAPKPTATVRVQPCNFITDCTTSVTGLTAQLCDKRDVGCLTPRLANLTQADGEFRFDVPTTGGGFSGYLSIDSPVALCTDVAAFGSAAGKTLCDLVAPTCDPAAPDMRCYTKLYAPSMLFFNPPVRDDMPSALPLQMFPISGLPTVLAAAGVQIDATAGNLFIQALDCDGRPAAGVTYQIQQYADRVSALYVDDGIVSSVATQTDTSGVGGFVRVPPGFVSVVGYTAGGVAIGSVGVQSMPSALTYTTLTPTGP